MGEMIASLHNRHAGEECAVLLNGPSLSDHDLTKIDCITIGVNRSWMLHASDYHIAIDDSHWKIYHRMRSRSMKSGEIKNLITGADGPAYAIRVRDLRERGPEVGPLQQFKAPFGWSWDLERGAYMHNVAFTALQVAAYMGFRTIYLLAFDLTDRAVCRLDSGACEHDPQHPRISKFRAHPDSWREYRAERLSQRQRDLMKWASSIWPKEFKVWNLSPITKCEELPRKTFEEVFIERKGRTAGHGNPEHIEAADTRANKGSGDRSAGVDAKKGRGRKRGRRR